MSQKNAYTVFQPYLLIRKGLESKVRPLLENSGKFCIWWSLAIWALRKLSLKLVGQISKILKMANFHFFIARIFEFWDTFSNQNNIFIKFFMSLILSDFRRKDMKCLEYLKLKYLLPQKKIWKIAISQIFWNCAYQL